jgi:D-alanyl-D-alanine carboxypeptidase/D-alanyl-D-alanine-endopeptidase (penicillin-binding protein 4)
VGVTTGVGVGLLVLAVVVATVVISSDGTARSDVGARPPSFAGVGLANDTPVAYPTTEGSAAEASLSVTTPPTTAPSTSPSSSPTTTDAARTAAVGTLAARLAPIVAANHGCITVTDSGGIAYQWNPTVSLPPASTQKLLVAAAALDVLGPNYRFTTKVVASAPPVAGRVGQLWLVGGGDPLLATPAFTAWWDAQPRYAGDPMTDLATLAASVRAAGVTAVTGTVHGDDSRYDRQRLIPTWPPTALTSHDIAPLSALTLNQGYQVWTPQAVVPADPPSFAAATFAQLLGTVGLPAAPGGDSTAPPGAFVIATIQSVPLSQILAAMLAPSDNLIAELLVKELGYVTIGQGTTAAGLAVVADRDNVLGLPLSGVVMVDGSGLDHSDRNFCPTLLAALQLSTQPGFQAIQAGLAVAGRTGTLAKRFLGTPEAGILRAKSGSIDNAGGLVGLLDLGHPIQFAMLFSQPMSDSTLLDLESQVVTALAPYATLPQP